MWGQQERGAGSAGRGVTSAVSLRSGANEPENKAKGRASLQGDSWQPLAMG